MKFFLLLLFTVLTFYSCETVIDEVFEDCLLFQAKPRMQSNTNPTGRVSTTYFSEIVGYVKNHDDDNFNYDFELDGDLPNGLRYQSCENVFKIYGAPTETGVFSFDVIMTISQDENVSSSDDSDSNDICGLNVQEINNFVITVLDEE